MSSPGRPRDPDVDDRIDDATRQLLREGGIHAVTVAEVARRAGVGRPTVYRRHADGIDLVRTVLLHDLVRISTPILASPLPCGTVTDQLLASVRPFLEYYMSDPPLSRSLLGLSLTSEPEWAARIGEPNTRFILRLASIVQEGKARGEIAPDADPVIAAGAFFALYLSTVLGGLNGWLPTVDDQELLLRRVFAQHLEGLRPR